MGACNFIEFGKGKTARSAFNRLVAEAEWAYGHDPYNGTISTTRLVDAFPKPVAEEWSAEARQAAKDYAASRDYGEKRESRAIDCGICDDGERMWAFYGWAAC